MFAGKNMSQIKMKIEVDEKWPVYSFDEKYGHDVELSEEFINRVYEVTKEYNEVQSILEKLYKEAEKKYAKRFD